MTRENQEPSYLSGPKGGGFCGSEPIHFEMTTEQEYGKSLGDPLKKTIPGHDGA